MASLTCANSAAILPRASARSNSSTHMQAATTARPAAAVSRVALGGARSSGAVGAKVQYAASRPARVAAISSPVDAATESYPKGYKRYELMLLLRPSATDEERANEVMDYEKFLTENGAMDIDVVNRGLQPLAYEIQKFVDAYFSLITYVAPPECSVKLQGKLSEPSLDGMKIVMRYGQFAQSE
eukprot:CAMPEP_0170163996 /NCGR_PEP_ID=MMETSP0033_2-20121228/77877_1 /TAXON_ID=195969 /ORGANISM="Dolichomastix tenuilepis, Strain CCMP3274" /LENGTH=183 /DNA_ID=CAMNT_0010401633 /DNA_START=446 /DNA_END=997 /DNA_ORIENTATION=-